MTAPRQIRFRTPSLEFAAHVWGAPDAPLALCLHGYPDTAHTWRHLGPHLAQRGWRVVAPFMRGYAPTEPAPDGIYQIGALARDAVESHEALGGDGRAVLIGHDWGATAAYGAAALAPERFARVVTMSIPPPATLRRLRLRRDLMLLARQLRCSWYMLFNQLPGVSERALPRLIPWLWRDWSPAYDPAEDLPLVFESLRPTAALRYYRALAQPWARSRAHAEAERSWVRLPRQPWLYLHGADDGCMLADLARRSQAIMPATGRVEIGPGAGHFLQLERPGYVNGLVADFLAFP